jgi:hypothetical protein
VGENVINDTYVETSFTANGTLTLPDNPTTTRVEEETIISTTSSGTVLISLEDATAIGEQVINLSEGGRAQAKFFGIARFNPEQEGTGRGFILAVIHTDSTTGTLAQLNGMILVGDVEFDADGTSTTTLWEWQSGIPLPPPIASEAPMPDIFDDEGAF